MNTCPKCGANVEAGSNFCTECGAPIVNDDNDTIIQMEDNHENDNNFDQNLIENIVTPSVDNVSIDSAKNNVINPTDEHHQDDVKAKQVPIVKNTQPLLSVTEQLAEEERYQEDVGLKQKFLRWDGRLSRKQFIIRQIQLELYACLFVLSFLFRENVGTGAAIFVTICFFVICSARTVLGIFVAIRRMHDLDLSGRKLLWCLLELPILYYAYLTIFKKSTTGTNRYGPDPLM